MALGTLAALPEVDGGIGIIGFCLGGSIAYQVAAQAEIGAPLDAVISFYGSMLPDSSTCWARSAARCSCSSAAATRTSRGTRSRPWKRRRPGGPNVQIDVEEDAGHAFHNRMAPMFSQPEPAARAWQRTVEFLRRQLPARRHVFSGHAPGQPFPRGGRRRGQPGDDAA